jgi:hypothetical protein
MSTLLGKKPHREDPRTLQLASYLGAAGSPLPVPPAAIDWGAAVPTWPMFLNDQIGDCTCAAAGHQIESWTADHHAEAVVTDAQVLAAYEAITGYNPNDPSTDQGAVELDVLKYWRQTGIAGHKIGAFVQVARRHGSANDAAWIREIKVAIALFGGVYIGLALPESAQTQTVWSVPISGPTGRGAPGSWGGHAVNVPAYDPQNFTCITWGERKKMTPNFMLTYCDEVWAILSPDWVTGAVPAPSGFNLAALQADLAKL